MGLKVYKSDISVNEIVVDNGLDPDYIKLLEADFEINDEYVLVFSNGKYKKQHRVHYSEIQDKDGNPIGTLNDVRDYLILMVDHGTASTGSTVLLEEIRDNQTNGTQHTIVDNLANYALETGGNLEDIFNLLNAEKNDRDTANEQTTPLGASATFTGSSATDLSRTGHLALLYASATPLVSVKIIWYTDATTPLGGLLGSTTIPLRFIQGYYVAYHIQQGNLLAPFYKLEVVNDTTPQTALPGFYSLNWLNKEAYQGVFDFVDAEPTNLTKALVVKQFHQKTVNLTSTPLGASGSFTTVGLTAGGFTANAQGYFAGTNWADVDIHVWGAPYNAQGIFQFYFSHNGVDDHIGPITRYINDLTAELPIPLRNYAYWRCVYTNGSVVQTKFQINIVQRASVASDLTRSPSDVIGPNEPVKVGRSLVEPSPLGERGILGADRSVFGDAIVGSRISRISLKPTKPLANNLVTNTVTNGGTVTQEPTFAEFRLQTSTNVNGTARMQTNITTRYRPGHELYCIFPLRFTTPTSANSFQRAGLFSADRQNAFFLGYEGLTFGFTVRSGGVDVFTPLTSASGDRLDATFMSRYARGAVLEPMDKTVKNIWRIRVGLLGSSLQFFDIQSPDGLWMRVHANRFPNLQQKASVLDWDMGFIAECGKSSADATNLIIGVGSVDVGFVGDPFGLEPSGVYSRQNKDAVATGTADALLWTNTAGQRLIVKTLSVTTYNSSLISTGRIDIKDGTTASGTSKEIVITPTATNQTNGGAQLVYTYPEGKIFTMGIFIDVITGTLTYSVSFTGYEEAN